MKKDKFKTATVQRFGKRKCLISNLVTLVKFRLNNYSQILVCKKRESIEIPLKSAINFVTLSLNFAERQVVK